MDEPKFNNYHIYGVKSKIGYFIDKGKSKVKMSPKRNNRSDNLRNYYEAPIVC
jgi:hypothetical protein